MFHIKTLLFLIFSSPLLVLAHSGGTDSSGCHTNRKTGDYHCHGGKKASPVYNYGQPSNLGQRSYLDSTNDSGNYTCGNKTRCGEMSSCAEARFYLTQCGVYRLDGDGDGTPCESICGR